MYYCVLEGFLSFWSGVKGSRVFYKVLGGFGYLPLWLLL